MTQWVENPNAGRARGPVALGRAWVELLVRPREFFRTKVAPGDQAPGLTFAAAVVLVAELSRMATVADAYPVFSGRPLASGLLWLLFVLVLVVPAGIHLAAALQTLALVALVEKRAGVSETVQVICYSLAPCAFLNVPSVGALPGPVVGATVALWGAGLLALGIGTVHDVSLPRAGVAVALPALLVFGYGFGAVDSVPLAAEAMFG